MEQCVFTRGDRTNKLLQVLGPEGGDVVQVHQDASMYVSALEPGIEVVHGIREGRGAYVYLIKGKASFSDQDVSTRDAAQVTVPIDLRIVANEQQSELVLVDVPMVFEPVGIWRNVA